MRRITRIFHWILAKLRLTGLAQRSLLQILASGPIPQHVGFVMDGNWRYARGKGKLVQEGHGDGYLALRRVLEICLRLNIHCVSVYAFAIDNFKRPKQEVEALMQLAESELLELCSHGDLLQEYGVKLNVIGRISLFPESVQAAFRRAEDLTKENNRSILSVCMPYSSRDEMTTAVEDCIRGADDAIEDITEDTLNSHLMSVKRGSPPLDILVRTSGVTDCNWPDFELFDFVPIILEWQRSVWFQETSHFV
ncbi:Decaprenyl diphosphate synthase-like protein [Lentinula raphanica]|nr:Decaprenyl diphosphate synthase-like protein [Lentinula raphanica]